MKKIKDLLIWFVSDEGTKQMENALLTIGLVMLVFGIWFDSQLVCSQHTRSLYYMIKENPELITVTNTPNEMIDIINGESESLKEILNIEIRKNSTTDLPGHLKTD